MSKKPKILLWDIESSNLNANFGFIFCIGYKFLGERKPTIISIRDFPNYKEDPSNDKRVVQEFAKVFNTADVQVTWYGARFDFPFVNTRLLMSGLQPLAPIPHIDGWRIAKYKLKLNSNRLDAVSRIIPGNKTQKTPIDNKHWLRAASGHTASVKYVEKHCRADIQVLEKAYMAIRPYASAMPNVAKYINPTHEGCPICGSFNVHKRGTHLTATGTKQRLQCMKCAHWFAISHRNAEKVGK